MFERAHKLMKVLVDAGFQAFIVGGFVRDHLLGIPAKDADIATDATAEQIQALFPSGKPLSPTQAFPVVLVEGIQIATFREDENANSRQDVQVKIAQDIGTDAARRDLTINALYMNIHGEISDPTGMGRQDIENRLIRFVGDPQRRIKEDALRVLRAIRFASKFAFSYEEETEKALFSFGTCQGQVKPRAFVRINKHN